MYLAKPYYHFRIKAFFIFTYVKYAFNINILYSKYIYILNVHFSNQHVYHRLLNFKYVYNIYLIYKNEGEKR